jgi:hypothetical protein
MSFSRLTRASISWNATRLVISVADRPGSMYSWTIVNPSWSAFFSHDTR